MVTTHVKNIHETELEKKKMKSKSVFLSFEKKKTDSENIFQ